MLDFNQPVGDCSTQELLEALMLHANLNNFNPMQILSDLHANPDLWISFFMGPSIRTGEEIDKCGLFQAIRDIRRRWNVDTLYVYTREDDCVFPLVDFGKKWQAGNVEVFDRLRTGYLMNQHPAPPPVVAYWWQ